MILYLKLQEKTSALQHYQSLMTRKQREYQQTLERCEGSQSQRLTEQQHRIEMVTITLLFCSQFLHKEILLQPRKMSLV